MTDVLTQKIHNYRPSANSVEIVKKSRSLFLVGTFGAGKDTIGKLLMASGDYHHVVSHTTRSPRLNEGVAEQDGVDYHFINEATAERMIDNQAFIEVKLIHQTTIYGTSSAEIQMAYDEGKIALTDIDVQGVLEYQQIAPNSTTAVFLIPPSYQIWQDRIQGRYNGKVDPELFQRRMQSSRAELAHALETNHFNFVINNRLDETVAEISGLLSGHQPKTNEHARAVAQDLLAELTASA